MVTTKFKVKLLEDKKDQNIRISPLLCSTDEKAALQAALLYPEILREFIL